MAKAVLVVKVEGKTSYTITLTLNTEELSYLREIIGNTKGPVLEDLYYDLKAIMGGVNRYE
jgi:hypothetical protein